MNDDVIERAHARWNDRHTSQEAAMAITPHLTDIQNRVLAFARERGRRGFTDHDLQVHLGDFSPAPRSRRAELVEKGLIRDTGETEIPAGKSRRFTVWMIVE